MHIHILGVCGTFMGSLAQLNRLDLMCNRISDAGMVSFSEAIARGSLASLKRLSLSANKISDAGIVAFAEALKPTDKSPMPMPALETLCVDDEYVNHPQLVAACRPRGIAFE